MRDVALFAQDDALAHTLRHTFEAMGAKVVRLGALSNDAALWPELARSRPFDVMVVHHTTPVLDVGSTLMHITRGAPPTPTVALVPDRHMAFAPALLDAGFDRCLPASLDAASFCAVVRALTRRSQGMTASVSHYGALSFNHITQQASVAGVAVTLTIREAQVLDILLKRVGQIVPKARFVEDFAPDNLELNSNATEVYMHRLRKKISHDVLPVRNIKRCGYLLPRYVDLTDVSPHVIALPKPLQGSVWPRYELVGHHLAV